jgi:hypothetical protein
MFGCISGGLSTLITVLTALSCGFEGQGVM